MLLDSYPSPRLVWFRVESCFRPRIDRNFLLRPYRYKHGWLHAGGAVGGTARVSISIPKIAYSPLAIANSVYLLNPWTKPTYHSKGHPDPISRFAIVHATVRPTHGIGDRSVPTAAYA